MGMLMEKPIEAEEKCQKSDTRTSRIPKVLRLQFVQRQIIENIFTILSSLASESCAALLSWAQTITQIF
ncbi:hypothetical protein T05_16110 [Trichinella murrelli]|uniref:Uncharacterized protein n=1 Tax=Trichinella murrelli TaxID=144512 RepID=A0A0V0T2X2_9BILA|nr:hypothetical protein T05_16110 [Trichinella murrelli]